MSYWKHFCLITKHKYYVARECFKVHLYWQGIVHDLSKYSWTEFVNSGKYFTGTSTPVNEERNDKGYSISWMHHEHRNKHHWQHWIDIRNVNNIIAIPIPEKYILEMACDIVSASRTYLNQKFDKKEPLEYILKHNNWIMNKDSETLLISILRDYASSGKIMRI